MSLSVRLDLTSLKSALASYVASAKIDLTSLSNNFGVFLWGIITVKFVFIFMTFWFYS